MAGQRATPTQVAHELGIRPQVIYGLIKRNRVHAYGSKPQMVDVGEVKSVLKDIKHRIPKEKRQASRANVPVGTITSWAKGFKGPKAKERRVAVATGILKPDDPDGTYFLVFEDGEKRVIDAFTLESFGEMLKRGFAHVEHIDGLLGMVIFQMTVNGQVDQASALDEFCRSTLDIVPVSYTAAAEEGA